MVSISRRNLKSPRVELVKKKIGILTSEAELYVPHENGEIAFYYPPFGPGYYRNIGIEILSKGLNPCVGDYFASLMHSAFCVWPVQSYFLKIQEMFFNGASFYFYNINHYTKRGVYVIQDFLAEGIRDEINADNLERLLRGGKEIRGIRFSPDNRIRFAPKGSYQPGHLSPEDFAKDGLVIASFNFEGAEKLAIVSSEFPRPPYIFGCEKHGDDEDEPETKVSNILIHEGVLHFLPMDHGREIRICGHFAKDLGDDRIYGFGLI